jgi:phosphoglycerate dehydrogenase-like enzyme
MKNTLCTPHLGANTEEAQTQVAVEAVELLVKYLATGEVLPEGQGSAARERRLRKAVPTSLTMTNA